MTIRSTCLALAMLGLSAVASAQTPPPLTLEDAITRGVAQAPRLAESRARVAAATAVVTTRTAVGLPSVATSAGYLRTNHVDEYGIPQPNGSLKILFPDVPNNYQVRADVGMPLYTSGRVGSLVDAAKDEQTAAGADLRVTEQDIRLQVAVAYWALVTVRDSVHVLEESQKRMDAYVGDVKARVDAGILPPNDLLSAQAQRARQLVQLIQVRNDAALAEAELARLIGSDPDQPLVPTSPVDQQMPGSADLASTPLAALVARATNGRTERAALLARQAAMNATGTAALAALRPSVSALASVQEARPNQLFVPRTDTWKTSWNVGVNVSWQLFDGGKAHAEQAASVAQAEALKSRLDDFDAVVKLEIRQRLLDLDSDRSAIAASDEAVAAATEALRVVQERFRAGVATSTDALDAQVALLEAQLERTRLSAALRIAEARLLRSMGVL